MKQLKKTLLTLVALLAVTTGAWAQTETLLTTITNTGENASFKSGNKTFDNIATVTFSGQVVNDGDNWGWYFNQESGETITVTAASDAYTITRVKFYTADGSAFDEEAPFEAIVMFEDGYIAKVNGTSIGHWGLNKIEVYGGVASPASSGPKVAWDKAKKSGQFTMPGGNVTLEPEYYPQAALTTAPTAINDVPATTDGAIVNAGTVANIGETTTAQGTVMYYVSPTALDDAALLALAADQWTADVPTAADLAQGQAYVYYYVRGNDSNTDEENFSDGDILAANALTVTIAPEPTYAVEFAEGTEESDKWKADPATGVKKGETVTVTYTGSKKVIGVKAEKKAATKTLAEATLEDIGKIAGADGNIYDSKADAEAANTTAVAMIAYVGTASDCAHGLAIALADESDKKNYGAAGTACSGKAAVTGGTWRLPSIKDWQYMLIGCGASESYKDNPGAMGYIGLASKLTTAQGNALVQGVSYWSSTGNSADYSWRMYINGSNVNFTLDYKGNDLQVRACFAF